MLKGVIARLEQQRAEKNALKPAAPVGARG
jgi:hypothetical protein